MAREFGVIAALRPTLVPVPGVVGLCEDPSVVGAPFFVMDFVEGTVMRDKADVERTTTVADRASISRCLVDTLADVHRLDPAGLGLDFLMRPTGLVERQLKRWLAQWDKVTTSDIPLAREVHDLLAARIPAEYRCSLVHGDYRLDNVVVAENQVRAVLDWELCTVGDPRVDVGLLIVFWAEPGDEFLPIGIAPTALPGFFNREEVLARYSQSSGIDLSEIDYFIALGSWKLGVIAEGVWSRYRAGSYRDADGFAQFEGIAVPLFEAARQHLK